MGTERDWQGVLGQKIPCFDNRIISKCKLLPKRNVCKANTLENVSLNKLIITIFSNFVENSDKDNKLYNHVLKKLSNA